MTAGEQNIRIFLVEDDEDDFIIIRDMLLDIPHWRCHLDWVSTVSQAMERVASSDYDVCLLDYRLGEKDGIEVLKSLKKNGFEAA